MRSHALLTYSNFMGGPDEDAIVLSVPGVSRVKGKTAMAMEMMKMLVEVT